MKHILFVLLLAVSTAQANPFPKGSVDYGKSLFTEYDCNHCHQAKMGGDGNGIFTRPDRKVRNADDLIQQITRCSGNLGANLTSQEKQDLGAYLNQKYYHF